MTRLVLVLCLLGFAPPTLADIIDAGTWVQRGEGVGIVLIIETAGPARKLSYKMRGPDGKVDPKVFMSMVTALDGKDAPVFAADNKPTGQTMAIRRVDANHAVTVMKMGGKLIGTSKAELSPDGKVMKVEDEAIDMVTEKSAGKVVKYWDRK